MRFQVEYESEENFDQEKDSVGIKIRANCGFVTDRLSASFCATQTRRGSLMGSASSQDAHICRFEVADDSNFRSSRVNYSSSQLPRRRTSHAGHGAVGVVAPSLVCALIADSAVVDVSTQVWRHFSRKVNSAKLFQFLFAKHPQKQHF